MKRLARIIGSACTLLGLETGYVSAEMISAWTFETTESATARPSTPGVGTDAASGFRSGAAVYSSTRGNAPAHSFSANTWGVEDHYQSSASSVGIRSSKLTWDQTSSNTGPRDFQLTYSTTGTTFTKFGSRYSALANASSNLLWNSPASSSLYSLAQDVSVIAALDNRTNVFFRLIANDTVSANGGAVVAAGTSSWGGNCTVSSIPAVVPLPGAVWLLGGGILAIGGLVRRPNA